MKSRILIRLSLILYSVVITAVLLFWYFMAPKRAEIPVREAPAASPVTPIAHSNGNAAPTNVYAHNLMLHKGPNFRFYVRWLRGQMARARRDVNPSFDDPDSFYIDVKTGVLRANIGDIAHFLNSGGVGNAPLTNIGLSGDGNRVKLTATLHKVISLPIELDATLSALPDSRIQLHVTKLNVLKVPLKGLLGMFHVTVADLFSSRSIAGIEVHGNDVVFDTQTLLPPPHIRGQLTAVRIVNPDLEEVYGNAQQDVERVEQWRNFLRLYEGTIDFGKLTMHHVDIIMVDLSQDAWFDLDLNHYQDQLVYGYTRMTPQAGLQIFMPDLDKIPHNKTTQSISLEWMKHRDLPPPASITSK